MLILAVLFIIIVTVIIIFASPKLSPIPYFPSNANDLPIILKALKLRNDEIVFDLGAGDGIVIFSAADEARKKNLTTKFVAVEMNPILGMILHIRRLLHKNKQNIVIVTNNMFKVDYKTFTKDYDNITVYLYVSPRFIPRIVNHLKIMIPRFNLVSYFYPIEPSMKPTASGAHAVYRKEITDRMV